MNAVAEGGLGEISANHYSGTIDGKTRFGIELLVDGDAVAGEPSDEIGK